MLRILKYTCIKESNLIVDGDEDNQFDVKTESGTLLVAKKLDWETKNHYNLTISVTDGIHVTLTTVSLVTKRFLL